jgi:hypothetical protein
LTAQVQELAEQPHQHSLENQQLQKQITYLQEQFILQVDALEDKIKFVLKENDRL